VSDDIHTGAEFARQLGASHSMSLTEAVAHYKARAAAAEARCKVLGRERDEARKEGWGWVENARSWSKKNGELHAQLQRQQAVIEAAHVLREAGQYGRVGAEAAEHRLFLALATLTKEDAE